MAETATAGGKSGTGSKSVSCLGTQHARVATESKLAPLCCANSPKI